MTLRQFCSNPADAPGMSSNEVSHEQISSLGDYELLSPETVPPEAKEELRAWAAARCLVLLHSHEVDVIKVYDRVSCFQSDSCLCSSLPKAPKTMRKLWKSCGSTQRKL